MEQQRLLLIVFVDLVLTEAIVAKMVNNKLIILFVFVLTKLILFLGVSFGQGVYFAVNSSLSDGFAIGSKKMFRVRVLVGDSCIGNSSMKVPSPNPNTGEPYDSTTDNAKSLYVCYHDNQCYPEYLISYA